MNVLRGRGPLPEVGVLPGVRLGAGKAEDTGRGSREPGRPQGQGGWREAQGGPEERLGGGAAGDKGTPGEG